MWLEMVRDGEKERKKRRVGGEKVGEIRESEKRRLEKVRRRG